MSVTEAFVDNATAGQSLSELVQTGDVVLLKASRMARLEEVSECLN